MAPGRYQNDHRGDAGLVTPAEDIRTIREHLGWQLRRRCPAAHPADPRPCEGQPDAVCVVDHTGAAVEACLLHGAVLLASLQGGQVYPLHGPQGSAIAVYTRARDLPSFDFLRGNA